MTSATSTDSATPVTLTATVTFGSASFTLPVDGGSVTFSDGGNPLGTVNVGSDGTAVLTTPLGPGAQSIAAAYSGNPSFAPSTSDAVSVSVVGPTLSGDVTADVTPSLTASPTKKKGKGKAVSETLKLFDKSLSPLLGPLNVVLHGLKKNVMVKGAAGSVGKGKSKSFFVVLHPSGGALQPGGTVTLIIQFSGSPGGVTFTVFAASAPK
jgi:hypothetical protein